MLVRKMNFSLRKSDAITKRVLIGAAYDAAFTIPSRLETPEGCHSPSLGKSLHLNGSAPGKTDHALRIYATMGERQRKEQCRSRVNRISTPPRHTAGSQCQRDVL